MTLPVVPGCGPSAPVGECPTVTPEAPVLVGVLAGVEGDTPRYTFFTFRASPGGDGMVGTVRSGVVVGSPGGQPTTAAGWSALVEEWTSGPWSAETGDAPVVETPVPGLGEVVTIVAEWTTDGGCTVTTLFAVTGVAEGYEYAYTWATDPTEPLGSTGDWDGAYSLGEGAYVSGNATVASMQAILSQEGGTTFWSCEAPAPETWVPIGPNACDLPIPVTYDDDLTTTCGPNPDATAHEGVGGAWGWNDSDWSIPTPNAWMSLDLPGSWMVEEARTQVGGGSPPPTSGWSDPFPSDATVYDEPILILRTLDYLNFYGVEPGEPFWAYVEFRNLDTGCILPVWIGLENGLPAAPTDPGSWAVNLYVADAEGEPGENTTFSLTQAASDSEYEVSGTGDDMLLAAYEVCEPVKPSLRVSQCGGIQEITNYELDTEGDVTIQGQRIIVQSIYTGGGSPDPTADYGVAGGLFVPAGTTQEFVAQPGSVVEVVVTPRGDTALLVSAIGLPTRRLPS